MIHQGEKCMRPSKGYRAGTRSLLKKPLRAKGKPKLTKFLYEFKPNDSVIIKIDSAQQKAMPHRRFHGKIGKILSKRGRAYVIQVAQGNAIRQIITRTEHLEPYTGT
jgi:large subunit ribosomal protein L21e